MDSIQGAGGPLPGNNLQSRAGKLCEAGSQIRTDDSFSRAGATDPEVAKQKILKDMIFSHEQDSLHMAWSFDVGSPVVETPMSSPDGKVIYAACADSKIHAVDTATGKEKWAVTAEAGAMRDANVTLSPDGKDIFITGQNGVLECRDASTGDKKWDFSSGKHRINFSKKVLTCGGRNECSSDGSTVYASLEKKQVSAIDVKTGKKKWDLDTGRDTYGKPQLSEDEKTLFIALAGQGLMAVDVVTGKQKGEFFGGDPAFCSAAIDSTGEKLFVSGLNSFLSYDFGKSNEAHWKFEQPRGVFGLPPLLNEKDGVVYAHHYDLNTKSDIFSLDAATGKVRWSYHTSAELNASPTLSKDGTTLYVGTKDGEFAAVDSATGNKKWGFKTTTIASPCVSPDGKVIYIGGSDGKLYALKEDALQECLARKTGEGDTEGNAVPTLTIEDGYLEIDGVKLKVNTV